MNHLLPQWSDEQSTRLEQHIRHTVRLITSSSYVTNRHLEQIVIDTKKRSEEFIDGQPHIYFNYIKGVFSFYSTMNIELYERRFAYFFQAMTTALIALYRTHTDEEKKIFMMILQHHLIQDAEKDKAPWPQLLFQLSHLFDNVQLEATYQFLSKSINNEAASRSLALLCSYIALKADKEITALAILLKRNEQFDEHELSEHFQLLKERKRWKTMKHWLENLFPQVRKKRFGSLQPYIDEMNAVLSSSPNEQKEIWERWLHSPSYQRFLSYTQYFTREEKNELVSQLLPQLEAKVGEYEGAKTYEELLLAFQQYELAADYLLKYGRDPHRLRPERKKLVDALSTNRPELAKRVLHQFIIRLVEKKSRAHYEEAARYLTILQTLYKKTDELDRFADFLNKLKQMYRTYRAFVEELKRIDL